MLLPQCSTLFPYTTLFRSKEVLEAVAVDVAREYWIFPIDRIGDILTIAIANPFDVLKLDDIKIVTGCQLRTVVTTQEARSEEHTSELQSLRHLVCRLLLEK